jgi:hypothetical protein
MKININTNIVTVMTIAPLIVFLIKENPIDALPHIPENPQPTQTEQVMQYNGSNIMIPVSASMFNSME